MPSLKTLLMSRCWNGDQTDYGLNFGFAPQVLRVRFTSARGLHPPGSVCCQQPSTRASSSKNSRFGGVSVDRGSIWKVITCPHCGSATRQVKAGLHGGNQRYKCADCTRRYTPQARPRGYPEDIRQRAMVLHGQGMSVTQIGLQLGINIQSIYSWLRHRNEGGSASDKSPSFKKTEHRMNQVGRTATVATRKPRPTIDDVAVRAGVSRSTVSNYLNDKGRMSEATRGLIRAAMDELHFTPSALVRAIHRKRTAILGCPDLRVEPPGPQRRAGRYRCTCWPASAKPPTTPDTTCCFTLAGQIMRSVTRRWSSSTDTSTA